MFSKSEFQVLCAIAENPGATQRNLAEILGISLGAVNKAHRGLTRSRLVEEGQITQRGIRELAPYKVDNAIIMAAGISSRFAPISYEKPKGLLKVRGEILIERQIEQLQEAGIERIIVVVGYKKELFFYLEDKYGVQIVVNSEFATRNNNSTLMLVRKQLGNSYICSSDDYFTSNPFEPYVWKPYYAAEYAEGRTEEWCLSFDSRQRITGVTVGGSDAWYMTGHAYFDRTFSERFAEILEEEYDDPRTPPKLWEQLYSEHIDELDMEIRRYDSGTIFEFDSLDEIRDFDPLFLENIDIDIFDNIASVLGCEKSQIHDVYPLEQGRASLSCHFATDAGEYVYRHPKPNAQGLIDWAAEKQAEELALEAGIDRSFIFEDGKRGWKLAHFIRDSRMLDPHDETQLADAMRAARTLHGQKANLGKRFDCVEEGLRCEALLLKRGPIKVNGYAELREMALAVNERMGADGAPLCPTHNNFSKANLLYDGAGTLHVIDWKYAGMSDYASDFGTFAVSCELSEREAEHALELYFGRKPTPEERAHNFAYIGLAAWCWYVWALQREAENDYLGELLYTYYRYARKYLGEALA